MIDKPLKKKLIKSLEINADINDLARLAKVNRRTIWLWKKDPDLVLARNRYLATLRNIWSK